jgi:hypothetical protein
MKEQFQYPCIGQFKFLDLSIAQSPSYAEILERVKKGEKFLDLGCCVGQEIRQLVRPFSSFDNAGARV